MRFSLLSLYVLVSACGQASQPPPDATASPPSRSVWFICDGINAPALFHVETEGRNVYVAEYDKPNGAIVSRTELALGAQDATGDSVFTSLLSDGVEAGAVRVTNVARLDTPGAAYTPRVVSVRLGERTVDCRWLPRTRLFAFTGRRSLVVHEDADGDLIYTAYDFADTAAARIDVADNGATTTFSAEVRGGEERLAPGRGTYSFSSADGFSYVIAVEGAEGRLDVVRNGAVIQNEPLIAFQTGDAAAAE